MTNNRFDSIPRTSLKIKAAFVKYLSLLVFLVGALFTQVNATITVNSTPPTDNDFCGTGSPTLILPIVATSNCGAGSITYQWYVGATFATSTAISAAGTPNYSGWNTSTLNVSNASALGTNTTYFAVATESSGACSDADTLGPFNYVKVATKPVITLTSSFDICEGDEAVFAGAITGPTPAGIITFVWTNTADGGAPVTVQTSGPDTFLVDTFSFTPALTDDQDSINLTANNACGTDSATTSILTVNPKPDVTVASSQSVLQACENDSITVQYTISNAELDGSSGGTPVSWTIVATGDPALTSLLTVTGSGSGLVVVGISPGTLAPGAYSATITTITNTTSTPNCARSVSTNSININVYPEPVVTFVATPSNICSGTGSGTTFSVAVTNAEYLVGGTPVSVNWSYTVTESSFTQVSGCAGGSAGLLGTTITGNGNDTTPYAINTTMAVGIYEYTLTGITNTSNACTGTIGADTVIDWRVDPTPDIAVIPTSENACESSTAEGFVVSVTNTGYCDTIPGSGTVSNVGWSLPYTTGAGQITDLTSDLPATPLTHLNIGTGSFTTSAGLAVGSYVFNPTTITVDTPASPGCSRDVSSKTFTLTVNPEPTVRFATDTIKMCEGNTDTFYVVVGNAVLNTVNQSWSISFTETGASALSGTPCASGTSAGILPASLTGSGNDSIPYVVPANLTPGFYTYTLTGITNTAAGCTGTVLADTTITLFIAPRPVITVNPVTKDLCELDQEVFNLSVTNSLGCSGIGTLDTAAWTITVIADSVVSDVASHFPSWPNGTGDTTVTVNINTDSSLSPNDHMFIVGVSAMAGTCMGDTTRDTFTASVDPRPDVKINGSTADTITIDVCQGTTSSFTLDVTNALHNAAAVNWEITYSESSGQVPTCNGLVTQNLIGGTSGMLVGSDTGSTSIAVPGTLAVGQYTYTLSNIVNTDGPCTGTVNDSTNGSQTIIINIYPTPSFTVQPDSSEVCENNVATSDFYLVITNAQYCLFPDSLEDAAWSISDITDNLISNAPNPVIGTGNGATSIYNSNTTAALTVGSYNWSADSITTTGLPTNCAQSVSSDTSHILTVNPAPNVRINGIAGPDTLDICEGTLDSFSFEVTNAILHGVNVNWEITYTETSGQVDVNDCDGTVTADMPGASGSYTGIGNVDTTVIVPATLPVGQYTYTVTNMENTDHSCTGLVDSVTSGTQTIIINVYPKPVFNVNPDSSEVCENTIALNDFSVVVTNAEYCLTHSSSDDVDWSVSGITNGTVSNNPSPITGTGNATGGPYNSNTSATLTEGYYSWDATTISTTNLPIVCTNTSSDSVHILQVNPAPDASFASATLTICEGDTDSLIINVSNAVLSGTPVNWSFDVSETSGNMTSSCNVDAAENASLARDSSGTGDTSLTYYIPGNLVPGVYTYTINNVLNTDKTCSGTSATSTITIYIYPKIEIDLTPTATSICEGDSTDFDIEVTNARYCSALNVASNNAPWTLTYADSTASDITGPPLTGSGNSSYTFTANHAGLLSAGVYQFITATITAGITTPTTATCPHSVPDTFTLTVDPEPEVTFSTASITLCEGDATGTFNVLVSNAQYTTGSGTVEADWTVDMIGDSTDVANSCASGGSGAAIFGVAGTNNLNGTGDTTISVSIPGTLAPGVYTYTLNDVLNTSNTCTGSIGGIPTITIHVYPLPDVDLSTDSLTICENTTATFDLTVSNAEYCATIGGSLISVNWEVTHTDGTQSTTPASVWASSGNFGPTTYTVNNGLALTNGGSPYTLDISHIENTTHTCVNTDSFSGTELTVYVNDLPVLTIDSLDNSICDGDASTIYYTVSDVGSSEGWSFTFSTDGGTTNHSVTGVGSLSSDTMTLGLTPPGVYTVTYSAITNDTTGCIGNTPTNSNITVLTLPDVTSFVNATGTNICSGLSNDYFVTVANAAGKSWEIFFTINGSADTTWTGTGNGTFTRPIPTQYHQDSLGAFDSRPLVIDSIKWTSGAGTPPLCVNSASITDPNAVLNVMPRPWITLTAPANVCINYTADIDYFVGGVRAADLWDFDWYTTGPADGPNNITGSDTTTGMFTTLPLTPVGTSNVNVPTVTNTSTGCDSSYSSSPWSEDIIVDPPTVPGTLTPNYTICDGDVGPYVFTLTGYTGTVQNWDSSENDGFTWLDIGNTTDTHTVVSPHLTTRYHVVVKSGACPADTSNDVILFVHPQPAAAIVSAEDSICEGSNINVVYSVSGVPNTHGYSVGYTVTDGTSSTTGTWTGTGSSATITETLTNGGSGFTAGTWTISLNDITNTNTGCDTTLTDSISVLVKSNPVGSTASTPNDTLCANSGGIVVWDGSASDGYVVAWQKKVGSGAWTTITGSAGDTLEFTSLTTTTQYRAVIENAPCSGQAFSSSVTITVLTNDPSAEWDLP
ncbi:MAG: hypothetical protein ACI8SE_000023, partial [Bacteroidia bacterium]